MKFLRSVLSDLKERQNLDVYITLAVAFTVACLDIFNVTDQSVVSEAILAIMALVSVSLLVNRRETDEVAKALSDLRDMRQKMDDVVSSLGTTFTFLPVSEGRFTEGSRRIRELTANAEREVLVLDYNPLEEHGCKVRYHQNEKTSEVRRQYYESLIGKVKNSRSGEFRYRRLLQIPRGRKISDVLADDPIFREHCEALARLGQKAPEIASLRTCAPFQERTFFIIDRRHLLLEWVLLDPEDRYYSGGGYLHFDDPGGKLVNDFLRFFERADATAALVKIGDLAGEAGGGPDGRNDPPAPVSFGGR
jgi:hypothetical protein